MILFLQKIALCGLRWFKLYVSNVKRCQVVKRCQILKHLDYAGGSQKKNDIMRFTDIGINFYIRYEGHQNCPKYFLRVSGDHLMSHQN